MDPTNANRYTSTGDDPIKNTDPSGLFCLFGNVAGGGSACRGSNLLDDVETGGQILRAGSTCVTAAAALNAIGVALIAAVVFPVVGEGIATGGVCLSGAAASYNGGGNIVR